MIRFLVVVLLFASGMASAADAAWTPIDIRAWKGKQTASGHFSLAEGLVETDIPLAPYEGQWIRFGASAPANQPDFKVWVHVYDAQGKVISRPVPTHCRKTGQRNHCSSVNWVRPGGARLRLAFWGDFEAVAIEPGTAQWASSRPASGINRSRYAALREQVRKKYYRSAEVDWRAISDLESGALNAPAGVDPIPHAMMELMRTLPGNGHTGMFADTERAAPTLPVVLPTCARLPNGLWKISLPATPDRRRDEAPYRDAAHACLARAPAADWLVDLTNHGGGNSMLTFAALAPFLPTGNMVIFTEPGGGSGMLTLADKHVSVGGQVSQRWRTRPARLTGSATFVLSGGCVSACESVAIAVKERFRTLGQATGGLTTSNDIVRLNRNTLMALTMGWQTDVTGHYSERITPDEVLDDAQLAALLAGVSPTAP